MSDQQTYPPGITSADHIAHDMRLRRFPERSPVDVFLAEREIDALRLAVTGPDTRTNAETIAALTTTLRTSGMLDDPEEAGALAKFLARHYDIAPCGQSPKGTHPSRDDVDPFWTKVIGGTYKPSGSGIPIKHIHPAHVKPVFDEHKGTIVADVIAALLFRGMMAWNNTRHAWKAAERAEEALAAETRRVAAQDAIHEDAATRSGATPEETSPTLVLGKKVE